MKKVCRPVVKFNDKLAQLLDDMGETMLEANGLGLAGPQVGVMRRVFVAVDERQLAKAEESEGDEPVEVEILEFINPEIVEKEGEVNGYEGCLSFPGQWGAIKRPEKVTIKAQDRDGNPFTMEVEGMLARCVCHENNHLDGVTIQDLAEYFYDPDVPHELDKDFVKEEGEDGEEAMPEGEE